MRTHSEKMKVVHAIWLAAWFLDRDGEADCEVIMRRAAEMLDIPPEDLFIDFDYDYLDRAWHSRPDNWKPADSLA